MASHSPPSAPAPQIDTRARPPLARDTVSAGAGTERDETSYHVVVAGRPVRITSIGRVGAELPPGCPVWRGGRNAAEAIALMVGGTVHA